MPIRSKAVVVGLRIPTGRQTNPQGQIFRRRGDRCTWRDKVLMASWTMLGERDSEALMELPEAGKVVYG